jgi:hypothetical protein
LLNERVDGQLPRHFGNQIPKLLKPVASRSIGTRLGDQSPDIANREVLARLSAREDIGADLIRSARSGELIQAAERQLQIRNVCGFQRQLVHPHEILRSALGPLEFAFEPGKPVAMVKQLFAFRKASADLDSVSDHSPAESSYRIGVLSQHRHQQLGLSLIKRQCPFVHLKGQQRRVLTEVFQSLLPRCCGVGLRPSVAWLWRGSSGCGEPL